MFHKDNRIYQNDPHRFSDLFLSQIIHQNMENNKKKCYKV